MCSKVPFMMCPEYVITYQDHLKLVTFPNLEGFIYLSTCFT